MWDPLLERIHAVETTVRELVVMVQELVARVTDLERKRMDLDD